MPLIDNDNDMEKTLMWIAKVGEERASNSALNRM